MIITPEIHDGLTEGSYLGTIVRMDRKTARTGKAYIMWTVETFAEGDPKNNGRRVFHNTFSDGRSLKSHTNFYRAVTGKQLGRVPKLEVLIGKKIQFALIRAIRGQGFITRFLDLISVSPANHMTT